MNEDKSERREVKAIVRKYEKDGEEKNYYMTVGTAWVSEHGSKISIQLDAVPVSKQWNKKLYVFKPYEKEGENSEQSGYEKAKQARERLDTVADVDPDDPVDLNDIPF